MTNAVGHLSAMLMPNTFIPKASLWRMKKPAGISIEHSMDNFNGMPGSGAQVIYVEKLT